MEQPSHLPEEAGDLIQHEETLERSDVLDPELREKIENSWHELQANLAENREGSIVVLQEQGEEKAETEATARRILMAGLGVKGHQVEVFESETTPGDKRYLERITTNIPGVEIVYADNSNGSRTISLAINHELSDVQRAAPTDIERVLRTAQSHGEWTKTVEEYGANWNARQEEVKNAKLLSIDIDECILPAVDRKVASLEMLQKLAEKFRTLKEDGMTVILNTGRSAPETQTVLEFFQKQGVELDGAMAEGGAIRISQNDERQWQMESNPTVPEDQWQAIQDCIKFIRENYLDKHLGIAEPKVSAVTFNLNPDSGVTGFQVQEQLMALLKECGLPTSTVEKADVSNGGIQLFASGIDKAAGMRYVQGIAGVSKEECVSVGDSKGDLPMFSESGLTAAPFNGARELREQVDYYSPFDSEHGVLDIVNQIIRQKAENKTGT